MRRRDKVLHKVYYMAGERTVTEAAARLQLARIVRRVAREAARIVRRAERIVRRVVREVARRVAEIVISKFKDK